MDAAVLPEDRAVGLDDIAVGNLVLEVPRDEAAGVAVRHEADTVAVRLSGHGQSEPIRDGPDVRLGQVADGEQRACQLRLVQREEEIRLNPCPGPRRAAGDTGPAISSNSTRA